MAEDQDTKKARETIADLTSVLKGTTAEIKEALKAAQELEQTFQRITGHTGGDGTKSSFGGANASSSKTPISGGTGNFGTGTSAPGYTGDPVAGQQYSGGSGGTTSRAQSFLNYASKGADIFGNVINAGMAVAGIFPTSQEALLNQTAQARLGFYQDGKTFSSSIGSTLNSIGTATSPLDAITAANSGAGMGLLPGLSGYGATNGGFGGILGGAALVSNLVPGSGLTGGMGAMAALNQGGNVNRLRMLGINVRNASGSSMQDLPAIIGQLYNLLSNSGPVTAENIAVSAMSGNALDSILNQYFGGDANLRQAVIAGLVQMSHTGGTSGSGLYTAGTQEQLAGTGGTTAAVGGISQRNASEYNMINSLTGATISGLNQGNAGLSSLYKGASNASNADYLGLGAGVSQLAQTKTSLETMSGGRSGAIGSIYDTLSGSLSGLGPIGNFLSSILSAGAILGSTGLSTSGNKNGNLAGSNAPGNVSFNINIAGGVTQASAQTLGQTVANEINQRAILELASASAAANS